MFDGNEKYVRKNIIDLWFILPDMKVNVSLLSETVLKN